MGKSIKTILITGFDPFGGEKTNPSFEAVRLLPDYICNVKIIKKQIPTEFFKCKEIMLSYIKNYNPDVIVNVGQAGGRQSISIEKQAFNIMDSSIADNAGYMPSNIKINEDGNDVLLSTLPIEAIVQFLIDSDIPCYISQSAGRFVCNYIMYSMLEETMGTKVISGFIHVPFSKEQVISKKEGTPYMEICEMTKALYFCLEKIIKS